MIATDHRGKFIRKWYERAVKENDPFDKFFSLWIAIVASLARWRHLSGHLADDNTDRDSLILYMKAHREQVKPVLSPGIREIQQLAWRSGSTYGDPILDTGNSQLRGKFKAFAAHYARHRRLDEETLAITLAEILNKIRNNVFHGKKFYDEREDIEVLNLANPILVHILKSCEPQFCT